MTMLMLGQQIIEKVAFLLKISTNLRVIAEFHGINMVLMKVRNTISSDMNQHIHEFHDVTYQ